MDAKVGVFVFAVWLLSLGLFGSLTFCVWNKQTKVANELADVQNELHSKFQSEFQNKLKSELEDVQNELHKLQKELKNPNSRMHVGASEPSQDKAHLKRNVRQADEDTAVPSATELLTNALTEIIERKLVTLNTTGWMWTSSPWFVWLFVNYIQCVWLSIQLGGCGRAHLGL